MINKISKKILVIGSGGREHALVWKIAQSKNAGEIYCSPGNAGTDTVAKNIPIEPTEIKKLLSFVKKNKIDLTIVGPEAPLVAGIVDLFKRDHLAIIGPSKKASQIESSKVFAKKLMHRYDIPTAKFKIFNDFQKAIEYLEKIKYPIVIKADGLCTGKGVSVCNSKKEAADFLKSLMVNKIFDNAARRVIIEECLFGQEVSFTVLTDGKHFISLLPSQDHKRIFEGDKGPNTGGMGAYAPIPFADKKLIKVVEEKIVAPILKALRENGHPYQGILYPGLIITNEGPKVLEFNCRFGDPETQPLMMLLKSDLLSIFESLLKGTLHKEKITFKRGGAVCVVIASKGYPGHYKKGERIYGLEKNYGSNPAIFHAGTALNNGQLTTHGGRVLGVTAFGKNISQAIKNAYAVIGIQGIHFKGMQYRKDIGQKALRKKLNDPQN